jgi:hypothetical protein
MPCIFRNFRSAPSSPTLLPGGEGRKIVDTLSPCHSEGAKRSRNQAASSMDRHSERAPTKEGRSKESERPNMRVDPSQ